MRADQSRPQRGQAYQAITQVLSASGATRCPQNGQFIEAVAESSLDMPTIGAMTVPQRYDVARSPLKRVTARVCLRLREQRTSYPTGARGISSGVCGVSRINLSMIRPAALQLLHNDGGTTLARPATGDLWMKIGRRYPAGK
jgi:hypothetical protein